MSANSWRRAATISGAIFSPFRAAIIRTRPPTHRAKATSGRIAALLAVSIAGALAAGEAGAQVRAKATAATVAALPPQATEGRGARVPFVEYEAESGVTNGRVIGPDRTFTSLAAEASGRRAVLLESVGGFVEFVLGAPANAVTLRYAVPDSATGGGVTGEITLIADGVPLGTLSLTSRYGWLYGAYPFTNRPADGKPHHFFDEARLRLDRTLPAGARVRFVIEKPGQPSPIALDLADFEVVRPPLPRPAGAISILDFGADPSAGRDSLAAITTALASGRRQGRTVWIAPGDYRVEGHLVVDRVTLAGAGPWYSTLRGRGVGVFGLSGAGGSRDVVLRDFAIIGEVDARDDKARLAGVGGSMTDSLISDLWIQHTKGGLWFDGPMAHVTVRDLRIIDQAADGLNFDGGVTDAVVEDTFVRNSGDDGLASWSHRLENRRIVFRRNTVIAPILANGVAVYGGRDITVSDNLVADTLTEGGGIHLGARFSATPFAGKIVIRRNTTVRAGGRNRSGREDVGALWIDALEGPITGATIQVEDTDLLDSSYAAIQLMGQPITGLSFVRVRIDGAGSSALQLQARGRATFTAVTARGLGAAGVEDCGSGYEVLRGPGDQGWDRMACPAR
jgi:hypothetical protein